MIKHARADGILYQLAKSSFFVVERGEWTKDRFVSLVTKQEWWLESGASEEEFAARVKPLTKGTRIDILGAVVAINEDVREAFLADKALNGVARVDQVCSHLGGSLSKQLLYILLAKSLGVPRVVHLTRAMAVTGQSLEALMPLQERVERALMQHLLPLGWDDAAPGAFQRLARGLMTLPVRCGVGGGLQDLRTVAPFAGWAAEFESCELRADLMRLPDRLSFVRKEQARLREVLPWQLSELARGLQPVHEAAVRRRAEDVWGKEGVKAPTQAILGREVARAGLMRADEAVDITAEELKRRGACADFATNWRLRHGKAGLRLQPVSAVTVGSLCRRVPFQRRGVRACLGAVVWRAGPAGGPGGPGERLRAATGHVGVHGGMTCPRASKGHAILSATVPRHNFLAKQLQRTLSTGGVQAQLEQPGSDGSRKRPGDVTCDSGPLGLPGRRTFFDVTVAAMQAPTNLPAVTKALGTQITERPRAWVSGEIEMEKALEVATSRARERKLRSYKDWSVERRDEGADVAHPSGVLLPGEELFIVPVSVFGTVGTAVGKLWRTAAECWAKKGAASSVGLALVAIQRAWRLSLWKSLVVSLAARLRVSTALLDGGA
jgi:hypothetical protein